MFYFRMLHAFRRCTTLVVVTLQYVQLCMLFIIYNFITIAGMVDFVQLSTDV